MSIRAWLLCLALITVSGSASALTIEGPFSTHGGTADSLAAFSSRGLFFEDAVVSGNLFQGLVLTPQSVGTTVYADASAGGEFQKAVASLTNGEPGFVLIGWPSSGPFATASGSAESQIFASDPLGTGLVDLAGFRIDRIGFRLDQLVLDSPGSDGNGDGIWTDVAIAGTLVFEGEPVPEPATYNLLSVALAVLGLNRWLL